MRNTDWFHMLNADVISMPDKWEYPWYAAWDLAFHTAALSLVDFDFAKEQLLLMLRNLYFHPNGQIPAYEWNFSDVNPPVHAWATLWLFKYERSLGRADMRFLERAFHGLMLNFNWWVNRKDPSGRNVFAGGFLGLDNIGVFDRSSELPTGGTLEQADGTAWMAFFCQCMTEIALILCEYDPMYEEHAFKFVQHFMWIAYAMDRMGEHHDEMWDEEDGFFYDVLRLPGGPRAAAEGAVDGRPAAAVRVHGVRGGLRHALPAALRDDRALPEAAPGAGVSPGADRRRLHRLQQPAPPLHPEQAEAGAGAPLRARRERVPRPPRHPLTVAIPPGPPVLLLGRRPGVHGRSTCRPNRTTGMFGGNSNWRGPVWMPVNTLIIRALLNLYMFYGDDFTVECPTGSGTYMNLFEVAHEITRRLAKTFLRDDSGRRPVYGGTAKFQEDPHWRDLILFYEYFHGDNGAGLGASHQTGWTGLIAPLLDIFGRVSAKSVLETERQVGIETLVREQVGGRPPESGA